MTVIYREREKREKLYYILCAAKKKTFSRDILLDIETSASQIISLCLLAQQGKIVVFFTVERNYFRGPFFELVLQNVKRRIVNRIRKNTFDLSSLLACGALGSAPTCVISTFTA